MKRPGAAAMRTCLIVDDSKVVRTVVRRILEDMQVEVREAENGRAALDACLVGMPDAILLDWNMPVMTGIDFLHRLRSIEGGAHPVVLFCSTENDVRHITEALDAGAAEYVMKPFDSEILLSKLEQAGLL